MSAPSEDLSEHLAPLRPLLGAWRTSGTVLARVGAGPAEITGRDSWILLPGARWVAHHCDIRIGPDLEAHVHQVIGGTHPDGGWQVLAFEGAGPVLNRLVEEEPGVVAVYGEGARGRMILCGAGAGQDVMTASWQRLDDAAWTDWIRLRYDRE